jgi:hypothetical protein
MMYSSLERGNRTPISFPSDLSESHLLSLRLILGLTWSNVPNSAEYVVL